MSSHSTALPNGKMNGHAPRPEWRPAYNPNPPVRSSFSYDSIEDALDAYRNGEFVLVMDDESRENEGDLIIAAEFCTTEKMAWMIRYSSGYVCIALTPERLEELQIPMMSRDNQDFHRTAFAVTVDYKHGTTTGISAHDRSLTARKLVSPASRATDFARPGHLVPLRAAPGGVLERRGHTEAGVDLQRLAFGETAQDMIPGGVLCELVIDDEWERLCQDSNPENLEDGKEKGGMLRRDGCRTFADRWGLKMINIEMLVEAKKRLVQKA